MKRTARKITLNRETLRDLGAADLRIAHGAVSAPCTPTAFASCQIQCPNKPLSHTNCD
jgi:hypothetical protein